MKNSWSLIFLLVCIVSCEGDYDVYFEWLGMKAYNAENSNKWPVKDDSDSISMSVYAIKLEMDVRETIKSGRYPDAETYPTNLNKLDSLIIISDYDFDISHPAGTNLTDYFIILNDNYLRSLPANGSRGYFITKIYADDFNDQYTVDEIDLLLIEKPQFPSRHQFHIEFRLSDGTILKDATKPIYLY